MYLQAFHIQDVRCFDNLELTFPRDADGRGHGGWVVLLGGNGVGKSTLLRAMALALAGPIAGQRLLLNPDAWPRAGRPYGGFSASLVKGADDIAKGPTRKKPYETRFVVTGREDVTLDGTSYDQPQLAHLGDDRDRKALMSGPYAAGRSGWFSCGYGPFRRLAGGTAEEARSMVPAGREARFLTLFREAASLAPCADWLPNLHGRSIDPRHPERDRARTTLAAIKTILDALLPDGVTIARVDREHVWFRSVGGAEVPMRELSDGHRAFLAIVLDLLRHLEGAVEDIGRLIEHANGEPIITAEGVVLIDEVDAHLHPLWQREIGARLRRAFPRLQFIVTSHSPFVAQAASDGGLFVLLPSGDGGAVEAHQPLNSVRGWRVDQILTSPLFGLSGTRDEETERLIRQHAELLAQRGRARLASTDSARLATVEAELAERLSGTGDGPDELERQAEMARYIEATRARIGGPR